jgi:NAD(P)-dependent dehydrogenase (short-subunit alcohol dehydrogenase family)
MATSQSMQDKICLVTGATSGQGKETALGLARMGATVVLIARNKRKGEEARQEIARQSGNENIDVLFADLSSQQDVRKLADEFKAKYQQLHVLVNNAGAMFAQRQTTVDGLEMTFALDHLAYFLLTNLLLDMMKAVHQRVSSTLLHHYKGLGRYTLTTCKARKAMAYWVLVLTVKPNSRT